MWQFKNYSLTPGAARPIKIVNHHNKWLNGKRGVVVGRDIVGYYNFRVWLTDEQMEVIVHQLHVAPADANCITLADVIVVQCKIYLHNFAVKVRDWLTK